MLEVVIDRTKWLRGEGGFRSSLLRESDSKMCCIGFACLAAGMSEEMIVERSTMASIRHHPALCDQIPDSLAGLFAPDGPWENSTCEALYARNDEIDLAEAEREARIISGGAKAGLEFKFIN